MGAWIERSLEQIRLRRLDRLAAAYAVAGWLLVQGASILLPTFAAPLWVLRLFIIAIIVGFPATLTAGWFLASSTPDRATKGKVFVGRKFVTLLAIGAVAAVVFIGAAFYFLRFDTEAPVVGLPAPNSIAVLPFANMSGDSKREYFSDGISEEVLNDLANTPKLRVAARTSSFAFKGRNITIDEIARVLRVRAILEGSVREDGNRVRITAQLISASDSYLLWSATYDRELSDILSVQSEIAQAITQALTSKLLPATKPAPAPQEAAPINSEAYRLYLQAKALSHRGNEDDLQKAADLLRTVTAREPNYAEGLAALSSVLRSLVDRYGKTELLVPAETAAREATSLDPKNIEALSSLTNLLIDRWQWNDALDTFQKVQNANPGSADAQHLRSIIAYTFNYPSEDIAAETKASELDPLQPKMKYGIALWYWNNKMYGQAATAIQQVLKLRQGKFQDLDQECAIEVALGHLDSAQRIAETLKPYFSESPQNLMNCPFYMAIAEGNTARARALTDAAAMDAEQNDGSSVTIGDAYRQIGDLAKAMKWYERAYAARDTLLLLVPYEKWQTSEPLVSYPAWKALWARQPVQEWRLACIRAGSILGAKATPASSR